MLPVQDKSMYDASHELQYLDMVIEETLRMYPPAPVWVHYSSFFSSSLASAPYKLYDIMYNIVLQLIISCKLLNMSTCTKKCATVYVLYYCMAGNFGVKILWQIA